MSYSNELSRFHQAITGPVAQQVHDDAQQLDQLLDEKQTLREMKEKLSELEAALESGDFVAAAATLEKLRSMAKKAGYGPDSDLMKMLESVESEALARRESDLSPEEAARWKGLIDRLGSTIRTEIDRRSDLEFGMKLDFQDSIAMHRRAEKQIADVLQQYDRSADQAIANLKA